MCDRPRKAGEGGGREAITGRGARWFQERRGCRDQILTLALLGQTIKTRSKKGMFAAFIDFKKAYDRVDRSKLWGCLEGFGMEGRMVGFLGAAYMECKCEVKVGDMVSESFGVGKGLR